MKTSAEDRQHYGKDWTTAIDPQAALVLLPATREELVQIVRVATREHIPLVPSGGRTGLAAAAVAAHGEVVVSLERLRHQGAVDKTSSTVRVGAGVTIEEVQKMAQAAGLFYPVDLAAKGSAQVGGTVNTNAGGLRVIRYGHTRAWVQSLEVVLLDGSVLELNGDLEKNNTGYDLRQLVIGSEGTLCFVTAATLKLCAPPRRLATFFLALSSLEQALGVLRAVRTQGNPVQAFEVLTRRCLESVLEHRQWTDPFAQPHVFYALVELESIEDSLLEPFMEYLLQHALIADGTLAQGPEQARQLWGYREGITESLAARGQVYKNDLALPLAQLAAFTAELWSGCAQWYGAAPFFVFGHLGDGNLHVNVLKPESQSREDFLRDCEAANDQLFGLVQKYGGSIAAEHGIGLLKKKYLGYSRRPLEIEIMRAIKKVWDPQGLLNPGKIFDL